jgi:hypothetical protein
MSCFFVKVMPELEGVPSLLLLPQHLSLCFSLRLQPSHLHPAVSLAFSKSAVRLLQRNHTRNIVHYTMR